jgi:hypothetical protein
VTWQASVWPVVIAQGLLLSGLIWKVMRLVLGEGKNWAFLATMVVLSAVSTLPWYVSQLMPDVFAGVLILSLVMLLKTSLGKGELILALLAAFTATIVHNSHAIIGLGIVVVSGLLLLFRMPIRRAFSRMLLMLVPIGGALLFLMGNQVANGHGFRLSRTSNLFLAAHLAEVGQLDPFLKTECPKQHFELCELGDALPKGIDEMLWQESTSLIERYGSWEKADSAVAPAIKAYFRDFGNIRQFALKGFSDGLVQMGKFGLGDGLIPYGFDVAPCIAVRWRMPWHTEAYLHSRQSTNALHLEVFKAVQLPLMALSVGLMLLGGYLGRGQLRSQTHFLILILFGYAINAFVMATLSCAIDRFQARISWLIPMVALMMAVPLLRSKWPQFLRKLKGQFLRRN